MASHQQIQPATDSVVAYYLLLIKPSYKCTLPEVHSSQSATQSQEKIMETQLFWTHTPILLRIFSTIFDKSYEIFNIIITK